MEYTLEERYVLINKALIGESSKNPIDIINRIMSQDFISMHGPEHHFLDGACFLVAYKNSGGKLNLKNALVTLEKRAKTMPGAMCGFWGVCGSTSSIGASLAIIHETGPLSNNDFYKDNMEYTSSVIAIMSKIGGPRCCKRNAYISISEGVKFVKNKYGIAMDLDSISCNFYKKNEQCIYARCPFFNK